LKQQEDQSSNIRRRKKDKIRGGPNTGKRWEHLKSIIADDMLLDVEIGTARRS